MDDRSNGESLSIPNKQPFQFGAKTSVSDNIIKLTRYAFESNMNIWCWLFLFICLKIH